jgi:hypothetical protein
MSILSTIPASGYPPISVEEEIPVTMQIAIEASDGFVLASDRKARDARTQVGTRLRPDAIIGESKIRTSDKHNIAVAFMGGVRDDDPAQEFVDHISTLAQLPNGLSASIRGWGEMYLKGKELMPPYPFALLVVNPQSNHDPIWKIQFEESFKSFPCSGYRVNGNETNSAIMWPEYHKCDRRPRPSIEAATNIAALTILTGGYLNPAGVGDLEIWQYVSTWKRLESDAIDAIVNRFTNLQQAIESFIR